MKTKLFLAVTLFAINAKAQLATINENFNSFTTGTSALPQKDWNKVSAGPLLYIDGTGGENYAQAYALFSPNVANYLITPQIVAPDGTKTITFTAAQSAGSAGQGTIEVGLVDGITSADMASFTSLGTAITLTSTTENTYSFSVPASTKQYIAFKFIGSVSHTALHVDNVKYYKAPLSEINENFNSFTTGTSALPQKDWNKVSAGPLLYIDGSGGQNYAQAYTLFSPNVPNYLITPQIEAPDGTKTITFTAAQTTGSAGQGTIEVGLVDGITSADMASFTSLGAAITLTSTTDNTYTFTVPASTKQYIAFRFVGSVNHAALHVDNVVYKKIEILSVPDIKNKNIFQLVATNNELKLIGNETAKNIKIYSSNGSLAIGTLVANNSVSISKLSTGVYFSVIETTSGNIVKSKFIKK